MSDPQRPYGQHDPQHDPRHDPRYDPVHDPRAVPAYEPEQRPGTVPTGEPADTWDAPVPAPGENLRLAAGRFWAGAAATVLVCALIGLAAAVIIEQVFGLELLSPGLLGDSTNASWTAAGALFALLAAVVLQVLVLAAPRPSMFFGWLVALTTVILAVLPFTGSPDPLAGIVTAVVWLVLGLAVWSMLSSVLTRTLVRPVPRAPR
jgi:hypothetical protein